MKSLRVQVRISEPWPTYEEINGELFGTIMCKPGWLIVLDVLTQIFGSMGYFEADDGRRFFLATRYIGESIKSVWRGEEINVNILDPRTREFIGIGDVRPI